MNDYCLVHPLRKVVKPLRKIWTICSFQIGLIFNSLVVSVSAWLNLDPLQGHRGRRFPRIHQNGRHRECLSVLCKNWYHLSQQISHLSDNVMFLTDPLSNKNCSELEIRHRNLDKGLASHCNPKDNSFLSSHPTRELSMVFLKIKNYHFNGIGKVYQESCNNDDHKDTEQCP